MNRNLIDTDRREVTLQKLHLNDVVTTDGGAGVKARLLLDVDLARDEVAALPYAKGCLGLLDEGQAARGANTDGLEIPKLDLKLTFGAVCYLLEQRACRVLLDEAAIHGSPRYKVVEGRASLRWWVEATVPTSSLGDLGDMLHAEDVTLTATSLQGELTLVAA